MTVAKLVSEPTRARETFRHHPSLEAEVRYNDGLQPLPSAQLMTSPDPVLTALAQLGACQLKTARALISLFDQDYQYVVAEATPTLPLKPSLGYEDHREHLWLCGTAIPRRYAVCEHTLCVDDSTKSQEGRDPTELPPVTLISDLMADPRFSSKPYCQPGNPARFYAGVPIRTRRGINIGVFCVVDPEPGDPSRWDEGSMSTATALLRGISLTITRHLEAARSEMVGRRNERMARGLGSFIEGKSTMSGWRTNLSVESFEDKSGNEGALNANQQAIQLKDEQDLVHGQPCPPFSGADRLSKSDRGPTKPKSREKASKPAPTVDSIFSRAANVIRESIEVEGVVFLDATVSSFGGLSAKVDLDGPGQSHAQGQALSSSDETGMSDVSLDKASGPPCRVIGFSTSTTSSIDGAKYPARRTVLPEKFLAKLLQRYPAGKIFNFDQNGALQSSDSSEDNTSPTASSSHAEKPPFVGGELDAGLGGRSKRRKNPFARQHEGSIILKSFPTARSVAFVPVWNSRKERWLAGGFVYTGTPTRIFTPEGELSYLRALGMLAMAETLRQETAAADKAKSDILSSLSHELRSPLHGVVLGVEMLHDTELDVFQGNLLHTLETCSRTLVDTIDHLLDYSKINNYTTLSKRQRTMPSRGLNQERVASIEDGMKSLYSEVKLDVLCEEVLESVFAGFSFQRMSIAQLAKQRPTDFVDVHANRHLDRAQAIEELGPLFRDRDQSLGSSLDKVLVHLDVDPACSWTFRTQPGAIRRIIMNLFGNSLKYTQQGAIRLSVRQETPKKRLPGKAQMVKLKIIDTGKGITEDYLRNELFTPFSQEDRLAPGTGLGLSLVKQIVSQLRGTVSVESRVGAGTTVSISLPMEPVRQVPEVNHTSPLSAENQAIEQTFEEQVLALKGLRIRLLGFDRDVIQDQSSRTGGAHCSSAVLMENICRGWLQMEVISETATARLAPDLMLCTESAIYEVYGRDTRLPTTVPTVVVCPNALVARHLSTSAQFLESRGTFEFISQPTGPRKLAKILLSALKRWVDLQGLSAKSGTDSPVRLTSIGPFSLESTPPPRLASPDPVGAPTTEPATPPASEPVHVRPKPARNFSSCSTVTASGPGPEPEPESDAVFLLVDDNHINLNILTSYMKKLGRPYVTATNGQEAVDTYRQSPARCKCIFMDISMPVMDGFEATRHIRAHESEHDLRPALIFALTGLASTDAQQEAFRSGIDLFLTKPVKLKEIGALLGSRGLL